MPSEWIEVAIKDFNESIAYKIWITSAKVKSGGICKGEFCENYCSRSPFHGCVYKETGRCEHCDAFCGMGNGDIIFLRTSESFSSDSCFHIQQCHGKFLKYLIRKSGEDIQKIHGLERLLRVVPGSSRSWLQFHMIKCIKDLRYVSSVPWKAFHFSEQRSYISSEGLAGR